MYVATECMILLIHYWSESFPKDYTLGGCLGNGPLSPIKLTYLVLIKVTDISFDMVASGKWKMGQGLVYMTDNCINKKFAHVHMTRATNRCVYEKQRAVMNAKPAFGQTNSLLIIFKIQ
jgi:hypothetical protein